MASQINRKKKNNLSLKKKKPLKKKLFKKQNPRKINPKKKIFQNISINNNKSVEQFSSSTTVPEQKRISTTIKEYSDTKPSQQENRGLNKKITQTAERSIEKIDKTEKAHKNQIKEILPIEKINLFNQPQKQKIEAKIPAAKISIPVINNKNDEVKLPNTIIPHRVEEKIKLEQPQTLVFINDKNETARTAQEEYEQKINSDKSQYGQYLRDYYKILIHNKNDLNKLNQEFKKFSLKVHPDKTKGTTSEEFKALNEIYSNIKDNFKDLNLKANLALTNNEETKATNEKIQSSSLLEQSNKAATTIQKIVRGNKIRNELPKIKIEKLYEQKSFLTKKFYQKYGNELDESLLNQILNSYAKHINTRIYHELEAINLIFAENQGICRDFEKDTYFDFQFINESFIKSDFTCSQQVRLLIENFEQNKLYLNQIKSIKSILRKLEVSMLDKVIIKDLFYINYPDCLPKEYYLKIKNTFNQPERIIYELQALCYAENFVDLLKALTEKLINFEIIKKAHLEKTEQTYRLLNLFLQRLQEFDPINISLKKTKKDTIKKLENQIFQHELKEGLKKTDFTQENAIEMRNIALEEPT